MTDLGDDPDGDLDGYDGGYGPVGCVCAPRAVYLGRPDLKCAAHLGAVVSRHNEETQ